MTTLRMLDSIYPQDLPPGADAYLAYTDGAWPTCAALKAKFPAARILCLAVFADDDAEGCDCENGDLTVAQVPGWAARQLRRGVHRPVVYASAASMAGIIAALTAAGIARSQVRLLSAHYKSGKHICGPSTCGYPQADGTQWTDQAVGANGAQLDESLLHSDFFGGTMSATGPASWDSADWTAFYGHGQNSLWWLTKALTGDTSGTATPQQAKDITAAHKALVSLAGSLPQQTAAAVIAALPPGQGGGLTKADVEDAVTAAMERAFPPPPA